MTQKEYIDFIRNSLPMVDQTSRFHHNQVEAAINMAVNSVFYDMYQANPKLFRKSMERYTTRLTKSVSALSSVTGRYNVDMAVDVVDLPRKTGGVLEVITNHFAATTTTTLYVPVTTMEGEQLYGSESSLPSDVIGFSWDGTQEIEFWDMSAADAVNDVVIRVIQQFKSYSPTDNVLLPYGKDSVIIDKVREYLGVTPPKDLVNDNADSNG